MMDMSQALAVLLAVMVLLTPITMLAHDLYLGANYSWEPWKSATRCSTATVPLVLPGYQFKPSWSSVRPQGRRKVVGALFVLPASVCFHL